MTLNSDSDEDSGNSSQGEHTERLINKNDDFGFVDKVAYSQNKTDNKLI